jgi:hypothetical protein
VVALAVTVAALHQLGPVRLGLSPRPMLDVLAAADARPLTPLLMVVVVLATVPAALVTFTEATGTATGRSRHERRSVTVACGISAAVIAGLAGPAGALVLAASSAFAEVLTGLPARYRARRD